MELKKGQSKKEENNKWKNIFSLSLSEAKKCRFYCINPSLRLYSCKTHNDRHGFRLHPPHLYEIKNGIIYRKVDNQLKVWYDFLYEKNKRGPTNSSKK